MGRVLTQSVGDEVEEGVAQEAARGKAQQHLEQVLVLVAVGLDRDQEQDEERSRADQQRRSDGLQTAWGGKCTFHCCFLRSSKHGEGLRNLELQATTKRR